MIFLFMLAVLNRKSIVKFVQYNQEIHNSKGSRGHVLVQLKSIKNSMSQKHLSLTRHFLSPDMGMLCFYLQICRQSLSPRY